VSANGGSAISIQLGNGDGTFDEASNYELEDSAISVAVGDVDGNGMLDLVTGSEYAERLSVLLGNGDGTFEAASYYEMGDSSKSIFLEDLNGDGDKDLVAVTRDGDLVSVRLNETGKIQAARQYTYDPLFNQVTSETDENSSSR
jgi:hypothetical protein